MASPVIQVQLDALRSWESAVRGLPMELSTSVNRDFTGAGEVNGAYGDVMNKWDENRGKMQDTLSNLAEALTLIADTFEAEDARQAGQLNGSGGGA